MKKVITLWLRIASLSSLLAFAACTPEDPLARVNHVIDGDTLIVTVDGRQDRVRLAGINAPEIKAACPEEVARGLAAKARMEGLVRASPVVALRSPTIWWWRRDKYGRLVAHVRATSPGHPGLSGPDFSAAMVKEGHAHWWWPFTRKPTWCGGRI